ncbi:MAG: PAS domain S-box protein [Euryarchaeota archaeon]|nr:PAS domain S-box protein [Euryarchaeota archaeon]
MKEVEGYLASIVESSADAIMSIDLKGTITSWNKGAEDIFGYKAKEIVGKHYHVIVPKELRGETEELRAKVLKKGYVRNYETYRLHRDGRKIPVNLTISIIKDKDGKPIGTSGIFKDLSERKKLEQEIKETRDHFRNILNTIQEKICVIDRDYNIVSFNDAFARGLKKDKIAGEKCYKVFHNYSEEEFKKFCEVRCIVKKAFEAGKSTKSSHEHRLENGSVIYHESKALPFMNRGEEINQVVYIVDDVTERRRLEKEIERTKDFLDGIVKNAPVGIFTTDKNGVITSANPMHLKMMGEKRVEQALGLNVLELPTIKALGWDKLFRKALQGKPFELHNVKYTSIYGKTLYLTARCTPLKSENEVEGLLAVMEDVTQQAKLEKKIKEDRKKLKKYAEQLEYSNKLKDLFIDIMRHDLLNSVSIIKGISEFLVADKSSSTHEEIKVIHKNILKLEEMTESASKLAKIESMKKIEFEEQDLSAILKKSLQNFESLIKEKEMQVEYSAEGEYPAKVNPIIEAVFSNLISNAVKYSPKKSRIVVGIEDEGRDWRVMVKDYGEGISDEFKETIFERFKRVDKLGVKGTGLGLAIVKRLVELHEGKVWVEDNPEGGSIFYVILPKVLSS